MDASIVLTTPQAPPPSATDSASPDVSREDAEAFAAHLPRETETRPAPRKPVSADKQDDAAKDDEDKTVAPTPLPSFSLTSPIAPVLVRADGAPATQDIALTPTAPAPPQPAPLDASPIAPQTATPATNAPRPNGAAPVAPPASPAAASTTPVAAAPQTNAVPEAAPAAARNETAPDIAAQFNLPTAATLAATAAAPVKTAQAEPVTDSLRTAGRPRGAKADAQAGSEAKPVSPATATAQAGARANANPDFLAASASATATTTASTDSDAAIQPTTTGEAAAVSLEARRAAEAPPVAVHRPPTVAATVAQHIIRRFDGKSTTIDVRLDPAELGKVSVKLEVGADSRVTAVVAADNPATLSDLMRSSRELERALESAGLELTQGGLSFDLSDRSSGNSAQTRDANASGGRAGNDNAVISADAATPASRPFGLESWRGVRVDVTV